MRFDFVTIGSVTRDILYRAKGGVVLRKFKKLGGRDGLIFTLGSKFEVNKAYFNYGGGANNVAVSLAKLGFRVAPIMAIGDDDFGKEIIRHLQNKNISTSLIQTIKKRQTGQSAIIISEQERRYILFAYRAANSKLNFLAQKYKNLKTKWLYLNSLNIAGWQKIIDEIIKYKIQNPQTKIYWNPGEWQIQSQREEIIKLLELVEVLQTNREEAVLLSDCMRNFNANLQKGTETHGGVRPQRKKDITSIIKAIYNFGSKLVAITDGTKGAYCYDGQKVYHQKSVNDNPTDTTGAGDAFGSGFVGGLVLFNGDVEKALKAGVANSGSVVSKFGAQNGILGLEELLKRVK